MAFDRPLELQEPIVIIPACSYRNSFGTTHVQDYIRTPLQWTYRHILSKDSSKPRKSANFVIRFTTVNES